jgi:hypothetical protein
LLVDFVSFSGELEMLQARLKHTNADLTIVYESDRSFTGLPKERVGINSLLNESAIYLPITGGTDSDPWVNEHSYRREAFAYLIQQDIPDDAIVSVCDVDEFIEPSLLRDELCVWRMSKFQMSARWFQKKEWASLSGQLRYFKDKDIVDLIKTRHNLSTIEGGWHLSSFLSLEDLQTKWRHFSHQELVRSNMDDWVEHCWFQGKAVEDGTFLIEQDVSGLPDAILDGPEFWFRGRPDVA